MSVTNKPAPTELVEKSRLALLEAASFLEVLRVAVLDESVDRYHIQAVAGRAHERVNAANDMLDRSLM